MRWSCPTADFGLAQIGVSAGNREKKSRNQTSYRALSFPLSELQYFIDELGSFAPKDPLFSLFRLVLWRGADGNRHNKILIKCQAIICSE